MRRWFYFGMCCALAIWMFGCDGCDDDVESTAEDGEAAAEEDFSPSVEPRVSVGNGWACFIDEEGTLDCDGELSEEFAAPPEGRFRSVSVGSTHACALDVDGHSHCWDRRGELGAARTKEEFADISVRDLAVPPTDGVFRDVAVADDITCAALDESGVQCWGRAAKWHEWDAIEDTFDEVVATPRHVCALDIDGDIHCWTGTSGGPGEPIERLREYGPFEGIDKANHDPDLFGAALAASGDVIHWPVGEKPFELDSLPLREGDYRQVVVGHQFQCALDADGAVECYKCVVANGGSEVSCEPGVDKYLDDLPAGPFEYLSAGWGDVCAVDASAEVLCWGPSTDGEPGSPSDLRLLEYPDDRVVALAEVEHASLADEIDIEDIGLHEALSEDAIGDGPLDEIFDDEEELEEMAARIAEDRDELKIGRGAGGMGIRGEGDGDGDGAGPVGEPQLELGSPLVGEFCDSEHIRQVVDARSNALQHCYERELPTNPELRGDITVQWRVTLDGSVDNVMVSESTLDHPGTEACIVRLVDRMRFDEPDGGVCEVEFPFVFVD